jgi:phosphatidylserine/phosphatidylglycerophosphate/cardiolipin synthase-like enzyme
MVKKLNIFLGRKAGIELLNELNNAKKSIKIISPYLSPSYINNLIEIKNRGINVSLITSDNVETNDYVDFNHTDLIIQKQYVHENEKQQREILGKVLIVLGIISLICLLYFPGYSLLFILSTVIVFYFYYNKAIYSYDYSSVFDIRVFFSQYSENDKKNTFMVHSKVYIIDDKIAYIGSLNFTYSGIHNSYECISRISDKSEVNYLIDKYQKLFHNKRMKYKNINTWGSKLYDEPKN